VAVRGLVRVVSRGSLSPPRPAGAFGYRHRIGLAAFRLSQGTLPDPRSRAGRRCPLRPAAGGGVPPPTLTSIARWPLGRTGHEMRAGLERTMCRARVAVRSVGGRRRPSRPGSWPSAKAGVGAEGAFPSVSPTPRRSRGVPQSLLREACPRAPAAAAAGAPAAPAVCSRPASGSSRRAWTAASLVRQLSSARTPYPAAAIFASSSSAGGRSSPSTAAGSSPRAERVMRRVTAGPIFLARDFT